MPMDVALLVALLGVAFTLGFGAGAGLMARWLLPELRRLRQEVAELRGHNGAAPPSRNGTGR